MAEAASSDALAGSWEPGELDDAALIDGITALEREGARLAARQLQLIAELARRRPLGDGPRDPSADRNLPAETPVSEFAVDEIAAALTLTRSAASRKLNLALNLATRLPETAEALAEGDISLAKTQTIVQYTGSLPAAAARLVEKRVLLDAPRQTVGRLRASLGRAVLTADPEGAEERHRRAAAKRRVEFRPAPDGMAELTAVITADRAVAIRTALDEIARRPRDAGDDRSHDARRADALVDLVLGRLTSPAGKPLVSVTVPITTLLGVGDAPGELAGYGPISAAMARRLASDGTWRRILTDPASGVAMNVGRTSYKPPAALAEFVTIRDGTCRFPGCRQPAVRCDLDHTVPYPEGPTADTNLAALCRRHHRLKHRAPGWTSEQKPDGTLVWISPTGHRYDTSPQPLPDDG